MKHLFLIGNLGTSEVIIIVLIVAFVIYSIMKSNNSFTSSMSSKNIKTLSITLSAVLLAAFFMPWINFFVSLSAYDIIFGRIGEEIKSPAKYLAVLIPVAAAIILYSNAFNHEKFPINQHVLYLLPLATLILITIGIVNKFDGGENFRHIEIENLFKLFGIGFWSTLISSVILPFLARDIEGTYKKNAINIEEKLESERDTIHSKQSGGQIIRPQININLPKVNLEKYITQIFNFIKRYKIILIAGAAFLLGVFVFYNLFFKANPVKDAKTISDSSCDCKTKLNDDILKTDEEFLKSFDTYAFKKRDEARNKLQDLLREANSNYSACNNLVQQKYTETRVKYLDDQEGLTKFDYTYDKMLNTCNPASLSKQNMLYTEIETKITAIKEPEPDIDKIKTDLIGQQIPGWNFSYLSEFEGSEIINTTSGSDRIEYQIKFHLRDETNKSEHDCEVRIVYQQGEQGWYFSNVKLIYITFINSVSINEWLSIIPLRQCDYKIIDNGQRFWVMDGSYGNRYKGGPDGDGFFLRSSEIFVMSRENHSIDLVFKYTPNN